MPESRWSVLLHVLVQLFPTSMLILHCARTCCNGMACMEALTRPQMQVFLALAYRPTKHLTASSDRSAQRRTL